MFNLHDDEDEGTYPKLAEPQTDSEKVEYILQWYEWLLNELGSFDGETGSQLSYLWPAILNNSYIEMNPRSNLAIVLLPVWATNSIWKYITLSK